jgi:N-dimethylarginine dimethylaminohydrolase
MILNAPITPLPAGAQTLQRRGPTARLLMCAPTNYALRYEINPWMSLANRPDTDLARRQWDMLYRTLTEEIGASVELVPQAADCPDMVFTANAAVVRGDTALLANFRHPERQPEEAHFRAWLEASGYRVEALPTSCKFEGEGDALFVGDTIAAGYLKRSDICAHRWLSETLSAPVLSLQLADDRWYHLDTCLFALDEHTVAYYPGAFDEYARRVIEANFDTIEVGVDEALRFACNAVVIGKHVALPAGCPNLMHSIEARGFEPHAIEMSEFMKAGGACKCLTLFLPPA